MDSTIHNYRENLKELSKLCRTAVANRGAATLLNEKEKHRIAGALQSIRDMFGCLGLEKTEFLISKIGVKLMLRSRSEALVIAAQLDDLSTTLIQEVRQRQFAYVPQERQKYFEAKKLFGPKVNNRFPACREDIKEAGNCLALGLYTACVFHLMRIAEIGMRAFAKHLAVTIEKQRKERRCHKCNEVITSAGSVKVTPIDFAMWDEVIDALRAKVVELQESSKGVERSKDFQYYYGLIDDLDKFKDVDRNELMHARKKYNQTTTPPVFDGVMKFMQDLSTRISQ